jgi:N-methylhydantoinase B
MGARPSKDGLSCTAFPSGVGSIPIEVTEAESPLLFHRREYLPASAGQGQFRGGLGSVIEIGHREGESFRISAATFDRRIHPARGRAGGQDGRPGSCRISNGTVILDKGLHEVPSGCRLLLELPGGGGYGNPQDRDPQALTLDRAEGLETR